MWVHYPFTKTTTSLNDHFWLSPMGGRIGESLLYIYIIYISLQNQTVTPDYFYKEGYQGIVNVCDISPLQDL